MGTLTDITHLFTQGYGWLLLAVLAIYELYAPKLLNVDTPLAPLVRDVPETVEEVKAEQREIRTDVDNVQTTVDEVQDHQKIQMQVQRAQARANPQMDEDRVDRYLVQNGVEPGEFLRGDEMEGYQNWHSEGREGDNS